MHTGSYVPEAGEETVVDFTDGGKANGVSLEEVLREMKKLSQ